MQRGPRPGPPLPVPVLISLAALPWPLLRCWHSGALAQGNPRSWHMFEWGKLIQYMPVVPPPSRRGQLHSPTPMPQAWARGWHSTGKLCGLGSGRGWRFAWLLCAYNPVLPLLPSCSTACVHPCPAPGHITNRTRWGPGWVRLVPGEPATHFGCFPSSSLCLRPRSNPGLALPAT